jgi:hypothetical protein
MKSLISGFLSVALFILPLAGKADVPNQVIMHYTGDIIVKPCTVSANSLLVDFGDVDISSLQNVGDTSQAVSTNLRFTNCDVDSNIEVVFAGARKISSLETGCGYYYPSSMSIGQAMPYGISGSAVVNGKTIDLACYSSTPLMICPLQREGSLSTSFDLPMTYRITRVRPGYENQPLSGKNDLLAYIVITYK